MRAKPLYGITLLALLGVAIALRRAPVPMAVVDVSEATSATENPSPPQDFAAEFMASRAAILITEAREQALAAARDEQQQRWDTQRRKLFGPTTSEKRAQQFESEAVDRTWATGAEAQILEAISQTGVNALDMRVECRTTVCRLELLEPASAGLSSVKVAVALQQVAELAPSLPKQVDSPAGTRAIVAYLAKK